MLELRHLTYRYDGRPLLAEVDLTVPRGAVVALLGPSGSGKSTLLRLVAGLEQPDAGSVHWDGRDITALPPERRRFALMFQDFALFPHLNVEDNVAFGLVEQGVRRADARAQARALLAVFGLAHRARDSVVPLSGGEQQRVALARALLSHPHVLLLDEPFSALDADLRLQMQQEFLQRIHQAGIATLLVTHDEAEARTMAAHGWRLSEGRLVPAW